MKAYISGKITGNEASAHKYFLAAEQELTVKGYDTVNPFKLNHNHNKTWEAYMREDIKALCDCTHIYMLKNWTESKGAIIEHDLAQKLGIKIIYQK